METLPKFGVSRADMTKRVARFRKTSKAPAAASRQQGSALRADTV